MARSRRTTSLALALAVVLTAPVLAQQQEEAPNVSGEWSLSMEGPQGMVTMEMEFAQKDGEITGTANGPMGAMELNGEIEGTEVVFWISIESGYGTFDLVFSGQIEENKTINGTMEAGDNEFSTEFTAERKKG